MHPFSVGSAEHSRAVCRTPSVTWTTTDFASFDGTSTIVPRSLTDPAGLQTLLVATEIAFLSSAFVAAVRISMPFARAVAQSTSVAIATIDSVGP